jgi:molybdopterin synthase sulfur carrier subunit
MNFRVLYFARLREVFGVAQERLALDLPACTLVDLLVTLRARGGVWADELGAARSYRVAVNQDIVELNAVLHDGDEVAIFPPVTGG